MKVIKLVQLMLILIAQCLLANCQSPGPGPGKSLNQNSKAFPSEANLGINTNVHARLTDKRVKFSILEGQKSGTLVGKIPMKVGYTYFFNDPPKAFVLNSTSGEIRTTEILDRESLISDTFDLVVLSSQPTYPIEVSIIVIDINDNSPKFPEPSLQISFSENANTGTRVILDTATDGDVGKNDVTTNYKIIDGNKDNKFKLVITTNPSGETPYLHLETTEILDREAVDNYLLNVSAEDGGNPKRYGFVLVNISILDVNDNSPTFDHSDYIVSLSESVPPGTSVIQVRATDIDDGENGRLFYYLSESESQFVVDSVTGVISTLEPLSCHRNCPQTIHCPRSCVFTVFARDHGSPRQEGRTYVTVNLQDANDHDPVVKFRYFSATSEFASVDENAENGSIVAVVSVIDLDEGLNGENTAEIRGGNDLNHFRLDTKDSINLVRVNGILDREKINKYNITIVATDKGTPPRSSTSFLIIQVNDVNDHDPVFERSEYSSVLSELVPVGSYVASVTANDEDTGINSNIFYDITSGNQHQWFTIDRDTGLVTTVRQLDREDKDSVELKISARDGGPNPKRAYTTLKITILDENDEIPLFTEPVINTTISEDTEIGSLITQLSAKDRDRGANGTISYSFLEDVYSKYPNTFTIDPSNGKIFTRDKLDREKISYYEINVVARDQGAPALSSTATVNLEILDVNDNDPEFYPQRYFVTLPDDLPLSTPITRVTASDKDEEINSSLMYELINVDNNNTFEINPKTGVLYLRGRLSRTRKSKYLLIITAKDRGGRRVREDATVEIFIETSEIKSLFFKSRFGYRFTVIESKEDELANIKRQVGRTLLDIVGESEDTNYYILNGDRDNVFDIEKETGIIFTTRKIDRETKSSYNLQILGMTSSGYGKTWVNITIQDINDNAPLFLHKDPIVYVPENIPIGYQLYFCNANDEDEGRNSEIKYNLTQNEDYFYISEETGMIYLKNTLNYGMLNKFTLEVTAFDNGIPQHSTKTKVHIVIQDVNDHTPVFEHEAYETSLLESTPVNDRFFFLRATDEDEGANGKITYSIIDGNEGNMFGIFPDGHVYVKHELDREMKDYFSLTIRATDHGIPLRFSTATITIHIIDENDNAPKFANSTFFFYLDENEPPDTYIGRMIASDLDIGRNAELTYTIESIDHEFMIDPKNGFLKSIKYFDREGMIRRTGQDFITMDGIVHDNGVKKLSDRSKIMVYISDVNDNTPVFGKKSYHVELPEGEYINSLLVRVLASDLDDGLNGKIIYSISSGNEGSYFHINEATGSVYLNGSADREMVSQYNLEITASDSGVPIRLTSTTTLTIDVLDVNDNAPNFIEDIFEISVLENVEPKTVLYKFRATDFDLGKNQELSYVIIDGNTQETFHIDDKTGVLSLHRSLDYESQKVYNLNVTVIDGGSPRLSSYIIFKVKVLDHNDNSPIFPNTAVVRQIQEGLKVYSSIVTVTAQDPDSGRNGKIRYDIVNQEPHGKNFAIDEITGEIKTVEQIDRERTDIFKLTVQATDQALPESNRLSSQKIVTIIINDINDNAPEFISMNSAILPGNANAQYEVMKIFARDLDANSNGQVTYDIIDDDRNLFMLERNGSLILREKISKFKSVYKVKVRATDEAVKQHIQFSEEEITILSYDSAQPGPQFSKTIYASSVLEGTDIGTSVARIKAVPPSGYTGNILLYVVNTTDGKGVHQERTFSFKGQNVLTTTRPLNRESGDTNYIVSVAAVLEDGKGQVSTAQVHVTVLDVNDSPPFFVDTPLKYSVSEDYSIGRKIGQVIAKDPDTLGTVSYSLVMGHDNKFSLDATSGVLSLKAALDREIKSKYDITVKASDGEQSTSTTVGIVVTDTNDNPPLFIKPAFSFDIPENTERGTKVGKLSATDLDEGTNGVITYSVISDWGNDVLSLNPQTGVFTLTSHLDYEQVQHYIFVVQAQDTGIPPLSSTVTVYFNILDLNDNAPVFDPLSYSDEVMENVTIGSSIIAVSASDQDSGKNGKISYEIVSGDDKEEFQVDAQGVIFTKALLDREQKSLYNLAIMATDMAEPPEKRLSSSVQVTIILRDVNDMSPEFVTPNETSIIENSPITTVVMAIKAIDKDEGRNSYIEYFMDNFDQNPFTLGSTDGLLRLSGPLDREVQENYTLIVTARDRGSPPNSQTVAIRVSVLDENDNTPLFDPKQYSASVPENASLGLSVLRVSATDLDSNSRIRYTIVAGDNNRDFVIGEDTGIIRVAKNLNYERKNHYLITVEAEDSNLDARYDSATVTISVLDINDNKPVFLNSPYFVYVMENMVNLPRTISTSVVAHDADNSPYNTVSYLLKEGDRSLFAVNASTGEIVLLKALDREKQDKYFLTVQAMDTGSPRLTGSGTITIIVQDENDYAPFFPKSQYEGEVRENANPGVSIFTLVATDQDDGINADIRYSMIDGDHESFDVDSLTGIIKTRRALDREKVSFYHLTVQAKDSSLTNAKSTTTKVVIKITDENDNQPVFSAEEKTIQIPHPTKIGDFVFGEGADDEDIGENGRLLYHLTGTDAPKFQLNQLSGIIRVSSPLKINRDYNIVLSVQDFGHPALSSSIKLKIRLRPREHFPVFHPIKKNYKFREDVKDFPVAKFQADLPSGRYTSKIKYGIAGGNIGKAFEIDDKLGNLFISSKGLDFEANEEYHIYISATYDSLPPLSTYVQININVSDYNDNPPLFVPNHYNASLIEDLHPPQLVCTVFATDSDSGINSNFYYRFNSNSNLESAFSIDNETGEIHTKVILNREQISAYELVIEAVDKGSPPLTGSATLMVNVEDKNNNPPRFTRLFSVNVTENADIGTFVIQVTSSDRDVGGNANVTYSFTKNPDNKFHIDPASGNVTVADYIDREKKDEYFLKVSASDGSWKAETPLTISVQDENDNAPIFAEMLYEFNFPEMQRSVAFVGRVQARDKDKLGPNSVITYALKFSSDFFTIDSSSGEILSTQSLKYKQSLRYPSPENKYHLMVVATDSGKPPLSSEVAVVINVVDENNNKPRFLQKSYFSPVLQNFQINQDILQVEALDDKDSGINAEVIYTMISGNGSEYFSLDSKTGWIKTRKRLNKGVSTYYILNIRASDRGVPPLHDEVIVQLEITDENEHSPSFTASSYQVIIAENEVVGSKIGSVKAFDHDSGPNGVVRYYFSSGNEAEKFLVDEVTGSVSLSSELDYDTVSKYELEISARDLAFKPQISSAKFTVILTDVNDNAPLFDRREYDAYIKENSAIGTSVYEVKATDIDSSSNAVIDYSIAGGNGQNLFSINSKSGVISSTHVFDYENEKSYTLNLVASNPNSIQQSNALVRIHIMGENEFFPKFIKSVFQFSVSESAQIETIIGSVQASDDDLGDDGIVHYLLVGSSNDKGFKINPTTGALYISRILDREKQNRVVLTVMAKNAGSIKGNDTDEAQVIISVQDGNDPPVFDRSLYVAQISEAAAIGTKVLKVNAVDSDVKQTDNQFTYTIIGGNIGKSFKINRQTGFIRTAANLDREEVQIYNLTVGAIDNGFPPQTGITTIKVVVGDVNDNGPQFKPNDIIGYVAENEPSMTSVMTLTASDPDSPSNGEPFSYYIVGGEHRNYFALDKATGEIKTTRVIDREITPKLSLLIEVRDNGKPQMKSEHFVTIIVLDKNDSPSISREVKIRVMLFNGIFNGGKLAEVNPNDPDISGQYKCHMLRGKGTKIFSIPNSCDLHATPGYHDSTYTLSVRGNDGRFPDVTSDVTVEFESFGNNSLDNSITIRVINLTSDNFLHFYFKPFIQEVSKMFTKEVIEVLSISERDNNTDLTIAAETLSSDSYLDSHILSKTLLRHSAKLTEIFENHKYFINYNPCNESPCKNEGHCTISTHIYEGIEIANSDDLIFSSSLIRKEFKCNCKQGFEGSRCEIRQDPCNPNPCNYGGTCSQRGFNFSCECPPFYYGTICEASKAEVCSKNPCENGGSCQSTLEGGFFCLCRPGFRGNQCEFETESCRPNPCQNGGSCLSMRPGYQCRCQENYYGIHCEKTTFSFEELSFMSFPALDSTTNDISIVFSTNKLNSLLVYNYGIQTGGRSDFVALEIINRRIRFSYGGSRTEITSVTVNQNVADGGWYKVTATRIGRVVSLSVAECSENGEICKECKAGNRGCYSDNVGSTGTLNFNDQPMYLGGVMTVDPLHERPNQVNSDDFIGCIHSVSVNGRLLNFSASIQQRGISNTCKRNKNICQKNPCGDGNRCIDIWSSYKCLCSNGFLSPDCDTSLQPITLSGNSYVTYEITEQYRRRQLLPNFSHNSVWFSDIVDEEQIYTKIVQSESSSIVEKSLAFMFRTVEQYGVIFYAATNTEYTIIALFNGQLSYFSKFGANDPFNITLKTATGVNDGYWHNLTLSFQENSIAKVEVDGEKIWNNLKTSRAHDFLDAYLTSFVIGNAPNFTGNPPINIQGFSGCVAMLSINGEILPFTKNKFSILNVYSFDVNEYSDCSTYISTAASTDPISVGITLVIVFFILLLLAICISFLAYRFRQQSKEKDTGRVFQNGSALMANTSSDSGRTPHDSGYIESAEMTDDVLRSHLTQELTVKKYKERERDRPQRPDIIEREVLSKVHNLSSMVCETPMGDRDRIGGLHHIPEVDQPEHYDLENASSIAPSDIDVVYHYKGYRDGNIRKYKTNPHVPAYHKHNHRHSPHNFPGTPHRESPRNILRQSPSHVIQRDSPSVLKMQSTPLARLSPSSELSQQTPRILTLQDLSGKPLQTALLASSQGSGMKGIMSTSERSLNSPVSHLSQSSGSLRPPSQASKKQKHIENNNSLGLTTKEIDLLNARTRNSSLLSTLDAVSTSSESHQRKEKLAELLEANTELLEAVDSSSDESGNDSFTCSEFEYDNNYEKVTRDMGRGSMIFSKLAEVENENDLDNDSPKSYDAFDSFRGSLSTLVASDDDDISNLSTYKPPNSSTILDWDALLNWSPNYESLMGVFKDIAELSDGNYKNGRVSNRGTPKPSEEYV